MRAIPLMLSALAIVGFAADAEEVPAAAAASDQAPAAAAAPSDSTPAAVPEIQLGILGISVPMPANSVWGAGIERDEDKPPFDFLYRKTPAEPNITIALTRQSGDFNCSDFLFHVNQTGRWPYDGAAAGSPSRFSPRDYKWQDMILVGPGSLRLQCWAAGLEGWEEVLAEINSSGPWSDADIDTVREMLGAMTPALRKLLKTM